MIAIRAIIRCVHRYLFLVVPASAMLSLPVGAASLDGLKAKQTRLKSLRDSIIVQRAGLAARLDTLANEVVGLKRAGAGGAAKTLEEALRRTLELTDHIERLDMAFEGVQTDLSDLHQKLREQYDREIATAIAALEQEPHAAAARRLKALQRSRGALEEEGARKPRLPEAHVLVLREEDGPGEIRQKADLMDDMAVQIQVRADAVGRRLLRLTEERRLRARMSRLAGEMHLFDETAVEGRSLSIADAGSEKVEEPAADAASEPVDQGTDEVAPIAEIASGSESQRVIVAGRETSPSDVPVLGGGLGPADLVSEIARLTRLQKALAVREAALKARAATFRKHLQRMLEEGR